MQVIRIICRKLQLVLIQAEYALCIKAVTSVIHDIFIMRDCFCF